MKPDSMEHKAQLKVSSPILDNMANNKEEIKAFMEVISGRNNGNNKSKVVNKDKATPTTGIKMAMSSTATQAQTKMLKQKLVKYLTNSLNRATGGMSSNKLSIDSKGEIRGTELGSK